MEVDRMGCTKNITMDIKVLQTSSGLLDFLIDFLSFVF